MTTLTRAARPEARQRAAVPPLAAGWVHVWEVDLDARGSGATPRDDLDAGERARAERFRRERDRRRYVAGRSAMRRILASYTGRNAAGVPLTVGAHGKPLFAAGESIHFNLSHSENVAVLAVTELGPVGVDVERVAAMPELEAIAERFFTAREAAALKSTGGARQERLFYRLWTRKESYLKAVGGGLSIPLRSVDISVLGPPMVLGVEGDPEAAERWSLAELSLGSEYVATVAVEAPRMRIAHLRWNRLVPGGIRSAGTEYMSSTGEE